MSKTEKLLLTCWFILNNIIGFFIVPDFGVSYDEPDYYLYAQNTVDAYKSFFAVAYFPSAGPDDLPHYGPAFIIFPELVMRFLKLIVPTLPAAHVWHFSYFFVFQLGGLCLYVLARRWFSAWAAWGILLLYVSQPLLWGHAFINPKDIPFMAFFLFTIWSGLRLADSLGIQSVALPAQFHIRDMFSLRHFRVRESLPYLRSPQLLLAGALLGMTMSIRLLGPLPGMVVILYLACTQDQRWIPVTMAYLTCALVIMFITWPHLWTNPIGHWMDSLVLMVNFPWPGRVLFRRQFYDPDGLPFSYLPTLLNIQLTEPLLTLFFFGLAALIFFTLRRRIRLDLFLIIVMGGILPLTGLIVTRATMYDNFRQILFLLPPLMMAAGLALEWIFLVIRPAALRLILLIALAAPGVYAMIELHPYEYVYYNLFTGRTSGAFRTFEMDYWCTSYREAALWLNDHAPVNAKIEVDGPVFLLDLYLRQDLVAENKQSEQYDYFVGTSRYNRDSTLYPESDVLFSIERDGAILAVIKQLSP